MMPEGERLGEICAFLSRAPSELGQLFPHDLAFLNAHIEERNKRLNKMAEGKS